MKILSRKNGIALVAVLAVLLVLTLLLPVMFRTSENATISSVKELNRQKASYLARTGTEMAVATLKSVINDDAYGEFLSALKNDQKIENEDYGIKKVDGYLQVELLPISLYVKVDANGKTLDSRYFSGTVDPTEVQGYDFVGETKVTISYNGDPEYYKVDGDSYEPATKDEAFDPVLIDGKYCEDQETHELIQEINPGYIAVYNGNYMVKSTATVNGETVSRAAAVVETRDMYDETDTKNSPIAYTEQKWSKAPQFVQVIEGDYPTPTGKGVYTDDNGNLEENYGFGGNQAFSNPFMASSKKTIRAFGEGLEGVSNNYYDKNIYIYSTIGNMHINIPKGYETVLAKDHDGGRGGDVVNPLVLGAYPGLNWRVFENTTDDDLRTSLQGVNYATRVDKTQRYNFTSYCATETLQVSLPVELRVNPKRSNRMGDHKPTIYEPNCTLFKVMNFQAKNIVFEKKIDLFASICNVEYDTLTGTGETTPKYKAYRGGFLNLTAPANTPYAYYNSDRKETVSAGIVYFIEPVYLWFQGYKELGTGTSAVGIGSETMFLTDVVDKNTTFAKTIGDCKTATNLESDLIVFKLFEAGDVYYFNAEATKLEDDPDTPEKENENSIGVNLVNWYLETYYLPAKASEDGKDIWKWFTNFRETLYMQYIANEVANNPTYVKDDMHRIGNINDDPTIIVPSTEKELYVIWDN